MSVCQIPKSEHPSLSVVHSFSSVKIAPTSALKSVSWVLFPETDTSMLGFHSITQSIKDISIKYIVHHGKYSQNFIVTINRVKPLKIISLYCKSVT